MNTLEQLVDDAAEAKGFDMKEHDRTTATNDGKKISKSARVREHLKRNPEARNVDVAKALEVYGVTSADVANVKAQLRKKATKKGAKSTGKTAAAKMASAEKATKPDPEVNVTIQLDLLEAGVEFIRKAGGVNEALHILGVVRRIRSL